MAKSLFECLEERDVEVDLHKATLSEHLAAGLELIDEGSIENADLVVLAMAGDRALEIALAARSKHKPLLDLTEELRHEDGAQWIFPGQDPVVGSRSGEAGPPEAASRSRPMLFHADAPAIVPIGLGAPIVAVLRALADLKISRVSVVTQESAAIRDQAGMDELSAQVRARFNMRDVEAKVFPAVLAFGGIPEEDDEALRAAIHAGVPGIDLLLMRSIAPTFSADSATVILELEDREATPDPDQVKEKLESAKGVHVFEEDEPVSSFDAVGRDDAIAGRVTVEAGRAAVWLACDRLRRGSATLAALAIEAWAAPAVDVGP